MTYCKIHLGLMCVVKLNQYYAEVIEMNEGVDSLLGHILFIYASRA